MIGGVCLDTGTIPSKTLREAVLYLTGLDQREMYGASYRVKDEITIADLATRTQHVVGREIDVVRSQLSRNRVAILNGTGCFVEPDTSSNDLRYYSALAASHCRQASYRHRYPAGQAGQRRIRRTDRHRLGRDRRTCRRCLDPWWWPAPG